MLYDYLGNKINYDNSIIEYDNPNIENVLSVSERKQYKGYINASKTFINTNSVSYLYTLIEVYGGETYSCIGGHSTSTRVYALSGFEEPKDGDVALIVDGTTHPFIATSGNDIISGVIPDGTRYLAVQTMNNGEDATPESLIIDNVEYALNIREELKQYMWGNGVNWVAFGDSITQKYYSYFNEDGTVTTKESGWSVVYPNTIVNKNHWKCTNKGYGGMGWLMTSTGSDTYVAYNRIKENDFTQYNLVTFAYGINDWKGNREMGSLDDEFVYDEDMTPTTVIESMRYCFEYIMRKNPHIKIVVITPLNCRGYSYDFGNDSTCWARGYDGFNNTGTLDEFADKMKEVCDSYGIECIDMTRNSCINKANIVQMLPDGVHPSAECHEMIGIELSRKINFC